jgi:hypothetical protein
MAKAGQWQIFFTFFGSMALATLSTSLDSLVGGVLILVNLAVLLLFGFFELHDYFEEGRRLAEDADADDAADGAARSSVSQPGGAAHVTPGSGEAERSSTSAGRLSVGEGEWSGPVGGEHLHRRWNTVSGAAAQSRYESAIVTWQKWQRQQHQQQQQQQQQQQHAASSSAEGGGGGGEAKTVKEGEEGRRGVSPSREARPMIREVEMQMAGTRLPTTDNPMLRASISEAELDL